MTRPIAILVAALAALVVGLGGFTLGRVSVGGAADGPITQAMVIEQLQSHNLRATARTYTAQEWWPNGNAPTPTPTELFRVSTGTLGGCEFSGFVYGSDADAATAAAKPQLAGTSAFRHRNLVIQYGDARDCAGFDVYLALISDLP